MPFIILQRAEHPIHRATAGVDLTIPGLHVRDINRRGELVLGERSEALKFKTEEEARKVIEEAGDPQGTEIQELKGPDYRPKPNSPLGFILMALEEEGPLSLQELIDKLPKWVQETTSPTDTLTLVKRIGELLVTVPPAVGLLLLQDHIKTEHAPKQKIHHLHAAETGGEDGDQILVPAKLPGHDHTDDITRIGKEVKHMATKTKTKGKAKAGGNGRVKKEKVLHDCHCGCGGQTFSNFVPGHDARVYSLLRKENKGEKVKLPAVLTANSVLLADMRGKIH